MQNDALANRLSALATAIGDATLAETGDLSESAIAAMIAIRAREPISIQHIAAVVGLTHSATVRLVDRLEKDWLVRRLRRKGREVMVETTARGKRRVRDLQARRGEIIAGLAADLSPDEAATLAGLIDRLLTAAVDAGANPHRLCRFCDTEEGAAIMATLAPEEAEEG
ncbi:DNA-binding MarR family transcriptional regulator [Rhodobium orientis]|uniref:HTH marR-type domain-containing protein n=1 Tax=Rhodobium orientis TaxID=34017 RepID=A0A327JRG3_9HYPH|nr:MarR family transcriptional regulator [Rhodobium orientis]MBB4302051.1 DNA-binding MarR family transcriptional regulator [Rhodobium orientis]MBK5950288.1 hypothetical protein [Rhodobium orientis]RAI25968.1 hypothetical protein CH339_16155 [Rhodobium orientis]